MTVSRIGELALSSHQWYRQIFSDAAKSELVLSRNVGRRLRAALGW